MDGRTDKASYRDAWTHLKMNENKDISGTVVKLYQQNLEFSGPIFVKVALCFDNALAFPFYS